MKNKPNFDSFIDKINNDGGDMTAVLFNCIVNRWQMSNQFLTAFLRRSMDTIKSYRYNRLPIPQEIADAMRRLHVFLAMKGAGEPKTMKLTTPTK